MKKKIILFSSIGGAVLIAAIVLIICLCLPKGSKAYRTINVHSVTGTVNVKRKNDTISATQNMKLKNEDVVEVKEASSTVLKLDSDKFIMAKENTTFRLIATGKKNNTKTRIVVENGGVVVEVKEKLKQDEAFEIASSNSVMAIRGTQISFNVSVVENKITTSVAVLDGETEIMLYKDEKLSTTTLIKDFKLSYTTDLDDVANDISKLIDEGEKQQIADADLQTIYNVMKVALTSEEIDEIVDAINTFERDDKKVNGVIKFSFSGTPEYMSDPKDYIAVEDAYVSIVGLQYLYSQTIDGEYEEFDSNNPLEIGTWYCKLIAGNAYRSDPLEFTIGKKQMELNYTLSQVGAKYENESSILLSFNDDDFFNSEEALERDELGLLKYYVIATNGDMRVYIDAQNKEAIFPSVEVEENKYGQYFMFECYLPEYYEVTNVTDEPVLKELENSFKVSDLRVSVEYQDNIPYYAYIDMVVERHIDNPNVNSIIYSIEYSKDDPDRKNTTEYESYSDGDFINITVSTGLNYEAGVVIGDSNTFCFFLGTGLIDEESMTTQEGYLFTTEIFEIDLTPYYEDAGDNRPKEIDADAADNYFVTINEDNTFNVYMDLLADAPILETNRELEYLVVYDEIDTNPINNEILRPYKFLTGTGRYAVIENITSQSLKIYGVYSLYEIKDGIYYIYSGTTNIDDGAAEINVGNVVASVKYQENEYNYVANLIDRYILEESKVYVYDGSGKLLDTFTEGDYSDFQDGMGMRSCLSDDPNNQEFIVKATINTMISTRYCLIITGLEASNDGKVDSELETSIREYVKSVTNNKLTIKGDFIGSYTYRATQLLFSDN
ncbi:MAG: FecR domain-containing protein [Acholeplasmatales bacterium]|nr:FecR domain-containing protein [Acholeplasmatales bacterium]